MGGLRSSLPVWEGSKVNPLAFWTFEDCWAYLRKYEVPYHPLHDIGFSSIGDMHSTQRVSNDFDCYRQFWQRYAFERVEMAQFFRFLSNCDEGAPPSAQRLKVFFIATRCLIVFLRCLRVLLPMQVPLEKWMTYGGERSGRFQGLTNRDGSAKTECGIHTEIKKDAPSAQAQQQPAIQEAKTS